MSDEISYQNELKSIISDSKIMIIGIICSHLLIYLSTLLITRNLGADFYGLFILASKIVGIITAFSLLGLPKTIIRFVSYYSGKKEFTKIKAIVFFSIKTVLIVSLFMSTILFLFSPMLSNIIFHKSQLNDVLRVLVFSIPFVALTFILQSCLTALKLIRYQIILSKILKPMIFIILLLIVFLIDLKLKGLVWTEVITVFIIFFISIYFLFTKYSFSEKASNFKSEKKDILKFSLPVYLNIFLRRIIQLCPLFFLGIYASNAELGIYQLSSKLSMLVNLPLSFNPIFSPSFSRLYAENKKETIEKLYKTIIKRIFAISLIIFFILMLFSKTILGIFGKEFITGFNILMILGAGQLINAGTGPAGNILLMCGRSRLIFINSVVMFFIMLIFCLIFIPDYGILGAAVSLALTTGFINILRVLELHFLENIHFLSLKRRI
ncbi:Polysaccharide biosynthesis protein C-terminal domain-containing protein [Candidatus Magnetomoraceae bacterium gMMP-15]